MPEKKRVSKRVRVDPDDAPQWTKKQFDSAELAVGGKVVRPAQGTLSARVDDLRRRARKSISISASRRPCSIIFGPADRVGRRASTSCFVNGSIDAVRSCGSLRNASEKLHEFPTSAGTGRRERGARIIYYVATRRGGLYLIDVCAKGEKEDLTDAERTEIRKLVAALEAEGYVERGSPGVTALAAAGCRRTRVSSPRRLPAHHHHHCEPRDFTLHGAEPIGAHPAAHDPALYSPCAEAAIGCGRGYFRAINDEIPKPDE